MTSIPPRGSAAPDSVLWADAARITVDDMVALDRVSVATRGARVLVLGDAAPLMSVLTGVSLRASAPSPTSAPDAVHAPLEGAECRVASGRILMFGVDVADASHLVPPRGGERSAIAGAAPLDPPLPTGWTAAEYVAWSARLAGYPKGIARDLAAAELERVGLGAARSNDVRALDRAARRALVLAHAAVAAPRVIVAEAPLQGLDGAAAAFVLRAFAAVTEGRSAIVSMSHLDPGTAEGTLARGASDVLFFAGGELAFDAPAAEVLAAARLYAVTVRTNAEALRLELTSRGIVLRGGPIRFAATLPAGLGATDILAGAARVRASVVDLYPLLG